MNPEIDHLVINANDIHINEDVRLELADGNAENCDPVSFNPISEMTFEATFTLKEINTRRLFKLFRPHYPRKLKKKMFGTRRQRRKFVRFLARIGLSNGFPDAVKAKIREGK